MFGRNWSRKKFRNQIFRSIFPSRMFCVFGLSENAWRFNVDKVRLNVERRTNLFGLWRIWRKNLFSMFEKNNSRKIDYFRRKVLSSRLFCLFDLQNSSGRRNKYLQTRKSSLLFKMRQWKFCTALCRMFSADRTRKVNRFRFEKISRRMFSVRPMWHNHERLNVLHSSRQTLLQSMF